MIAGVLVFADHMSPRSARFNNVEKDKKGGLARTHKKSLEVINSVSESLDLIDAWRLTLPDLHGDKKSLKSNVDLISF